LSGTSPATRRSGRRIGPWSHIYSRFPVVLSRHARCAKIRMYC
jgi:hypothetical protein